MPFPQQFPKHCPSCLAKHSKPEWLKLKELAPTFREYSVVDVRECTCGVALRVIVPVREAA